jgi:Holliday junction resolvase
VSRVSRDKGARIEREIVRLHLELGVKAERAPLSGAAHYRGNGEGFALLERWLGDADMLFLRRNRAEPLVVVPWRVWARLLS